MKTTFFKSFGYALSGVAAGLRRERNLRIHVACAIATSALAVSLRLSALELAILALTMASVIAAELLNSAVEAAVDLVTRDIHPLAKLAKDTAAGAVLVLAAAACVVGALILGPRLYALVVSP